MKIALGSDHAGFNLKCHMLCYIRSLGHEVIDMGQFDSEPSGDYPLVAAIVGKAVVENQVDRGWLVCGTGIGMSIAANKVPGVRATLANDLFSAQSSRQHNDSNVLVIGARLVTEYMAKKITNIWLETAFEGGRHVERNNKFTEIEKKYNK